MVATSVASIISCMNRRLNIGLRLSLFLGGTVILIIMDLICITCLAQLNTEVATIAEHQAKSVNGHNASYRCR